MGPAGLPCVGSGAWYTRRVHGPALAALAAVFALAGEPEDASRMRCLLARPLIVGASMSDQLTATDPGTLLARKWGGGPGVVRRAQAGRPSPDILAEVSAEDLASASLVIALDLFFWDARRGPCATAVRHARDFLGRLEGVGARAAFGSLPPQAGECGAAVSKALYKACRAAPSRCVVVDLGSPAEELDRTGVIDGDGGRVPRGAVTKDGLHPTELAARGIADALERKLLASPLSCRAP